MMLPACSNDVSDLSSETSDTELATVNIHVSTRANDGTDSNMDADEGIKTLRIIVLDENWKILENWYQEGLGGTEGKTEEQAITMQLPRTKVRFLAIANEKSMGRSFDTETLMADNFFDYATNGLKNIFNRAWDDATPIFPKTAANIVQYGLPMTGVQGCHDIFSGEGDGTSDGEHHDYNHELYQDSNYPFDLSGITSINIEIPLVRCVSKLVVNVTNAMERELSVQEVNWGWFFANKVYYYAHDPLHQPYNTTLRTWDVNTVQTISAKDTKTVLTGYFYPVGLANTDPDHNFVIALKTGLATDEYKPFLLKNDPSGVTKISRNSLVTINCTVNLQGLQVSTEWELVVQHWDDKGNMNIEFN